VAVGQRQRLYSQMGYINHKRINEDIQPASPGEIRFTLVSERLPGVISASSKAVKYIKGSKPDLSH
jgi:hypothetical protein